MATKAKTDETVDPTDAGQAGATSDELVTPQEHAQVTAELAPTDSVVELDNPTEVAARSADMEKPSEKHTKVFVLAPGDYSMASGYDHTANKSATRQYMISQGMWPTGDVEFVSNKLHTDGKSRVLTYAVAAEPAHDIQPESPHPEVVGQADVKRNKTGQAVGLEADTDPRNAAPLTGADDQTVADK